MSKVPLNILGGNVILFLLQKEWKKNHVSNLIGEKKCSSLFLLMLEIAIKKPT